jgi:hypothetical protein
MGKEVTQTSLEEKKLLGAFQINGQTILLVEMAASIPPMVPL